MRSVEISEILRGILEVVSISKIFPLMIQNEKIYLRNQTNDFDEQELCDSIKKNGLLTPIIV